MSQGILELIGQACLLLAAGAISGYGGDHLLGGTEADLLFGDLPTTAGTSVPPSVTLPALKGEHDFDGGDDALWGMGSEGSENDVPWDDADLKAGFTPMISCVVETCSSALTLTRSQISVMRSQSRGLPCMA